MVRLKVTVYHGTLKGLDSFNSKMVRLKEFDYNFKGSGAPGFNSKMVRLKATCSAAFLSK